MKWLSKGKELDRLAEKIMNCEEYYVWGNGRTGQFMINCLKGLVRIPVVLDSAVSSNLCTTSNGGGVPGYFTRASGKLGREKDHHCL